MATKKFDKKEQVTAVIECWRPNNKSVKYNDGSGSYYDTKSVLKEKVDWTCNSKAELFRKFYDENNRLRYCNGHRYAFADTNIQSEYWEWNRSLSKSESFEMFYGNGVVD